MAAGRQERKQGMNLTSLGVFHDGRWTLQTEIHKIAKKKKIYRNAEYCEQTGMAVGFCRASRDAARGKRNLHCKGCKKLSVKENRLP